MASLVLSPAPWTRLSLLRLRLDFGAVIPRLQSVAVPSKASFSSPPRETPAILSTRNLPYPTSGLNNSVFEDTSEEYSAVSVTRSTQAQASSPSESEDTPAMLSIRALPYPSTGLDTSVFEDMTDEYGAIPVTLSSQAIKSRHPSRILAGLVHQKQFSTAMKVREELVEMGIKIKPNWVYAKMALHALSDNENDKKQQAADFLAWWSLIPHASAQYLSRHTLREFINKDLVVDIAVLARFALTAASLGHGSRVAEDIIPVIVRNAHPDFSAAFMRKFREADLRFQRTRHRRDTHKTPERASRLWLRDHKRQFGKWYALAIRTQCLASRYSDAVELLQTSHAFRLPCPNFTYSFLLLHLRRAGQWKLAALVQSLWKNSDLQWRKKQQTEEAYMTVAEEQAATITIPEHIVDPIEALRHFLRTLKRPTPHQFLSLIRTYNIDDPDTLMRLRRRIFHRKSAFVRSSWLAAEMTTLTEHSHYNAALLLFANHFFATGVPTWALNQMQELVAREREKPQNPDVLPVLFTVEKMSPWGYHIAHLWQLAVSQAIDVWHLENLYKELLTLVKTSNVHPVQDGQSSAIAESPSLSVAAPALFNGTHFHYFVDAFIRLRRTPRADRIVANMRDLGISPELDTFRSLIYSYALMQNMGRITQFLDMLEAPGVQNCIPIEAAVQSSSEGSSGAGGDPHATTRFPRPDISLYVTAIRGFMEVQQTVHARSIIERLWAKPEYLTHHNEALTESLKQLHDQLSQGLYSLQSINPRVAHSKVLIAS